MRVEKDIGVVSKESRALLDGEKRGEDVVHGKGDKSSVPEAHFAGVVEDGLGGEVVGAADVRVGVMLKKVATPKPMEGAVNGTAAVACVNADAGLNI